MIKIKDLDIENCKEETILDVSRTKINDLSGIEKFTNLKWLDISNTDIDSSSLKYISKLTNLRTIYASNTNISDISDLKDLVNLETLDLYNTNLNSLIGLQNLRKLKVFFCTATFIEDAVIIQGMTIEERIDLAKAELRKKYLKKLK